MSSAASSTCGGGGGGLVTGRHSGASSASRSLFRANSIFVRCARSADRVPQAVTQRSVVGQSLRQPIVDLLAARHRAPSRTLCPGVFSSRTSRIPTAPPRCAEVQPPSSAAVARRSSTVSSHSPPAQARRTCRARGACAAARSPTSPSEIDPVRRSLQNTNRPLNGSCPSTLVTAASRRSPCACLSRRAVGHRRRQAQHRV
jgi:hypothetical protein